MPVLLDSYLLLLALHPRVMLALRFVKPREGSPSGMEELRQETSYAVAAPTPLTRQRLETA
jgi:hypothetical protein